MTAPVLLRTRVAFVPVGWATLPLVMPVDTCQLKLAALGGAAGASQGDIGGEGGVVAFCVTFYV